MPDVGADAAEREAYVLRLGAAGHSRAEIAAALGMSLAQLAASETEAPGVAAALRRAGDLALAWWEAAPRQAYEAGVRFNYAAWGREMRRRFGDERPKGMRAGVRAGSAPAQPRVRATYLLPCDGRTKLRPDGTCPCDAYHNEEYWRAEDEEWRAENPDDFDDDPEFDDEETTDNAEL